MCSPCSAAQNAGYGCPRCDFRRIRRRCYVRALRGHEPPGSMLFCRSPGPLRNAEGLPSSAANRLDDVVAMPAVAIIGRTPRVEACDRRLNRPPRLEANSRLSGPKYGTRRHATTSPGFSCSQSCPPPALFTAWVPTRCLCGPYRKKQITRIQTAHNRNTMKPRAPFPALSVVTLTPATSHTSVRTAPAHPSQVGNTRARSAARARLRRRAPPPRRRSWR